MSTLMALLLVVGVLLAIYVRAVMAITSVLFSALLEEESESPSDEEGLRRARALTEYKDVHEGGCLREEEIHDFIQGWLPPDVLAVIDQHIRSCPRCWAAWEKVHAPTHRGKNPNDRNSR